MTEPRYKRFVVMCNSKERQLFVELADRLNRSQGDAVRTVVREAVHILREQESEYSNPPASAA